MLWWSAVEAGGQIMVALVVGRVVSLRLMVGAWSTVEVGLFDPWWSGAWSTFRGRVDVPLVAVSLVDLTRSGGRPPGGRVRG